MKKLYTTIFIACFLSVTKAQTYYPMLDSVANNWYITSNYMPVAPPPASSTLCSYGFPPSFTSYVIYSTSDTVINAYNYKILEQHAFASSFSCLYGYLREDTAMQKIYFMDNLFAPEELLYNFSMQIGDSISLNFLQQGMYENGFYRLDSIGTKQIAAGIRPVYYLNCHACLQSITLEWLMSVGNLSHIVYTHSSNSLSFGFFNFICTGFQYNAFEITTCFDHNQKVYIDSCARAVASTTGCLLYADSCNYWNICSGVEEFGSIQSLTVSPNPASDEITVTIQSLKNNDADFILRDINGKEIKSIHKNISAGNSQLKINTRKLNSGIYFIQCITKDGTLYRKVVVNRQP